MGFSNPAALWLLLVVPLLWLRRPVPRRRVPVAALHLWHAAAPDQVSAARQRPRADLLVLLRTGAAAALIAALAGPSLGLPGQHVALVIDVSASMGAASGQVRRIDDALRRAAALADGMPLLTSIDVIAAGAVPTVAGSYRARAAGLGQTLSALAPMPEEADLDAALRRAATLGAVHAYVVTDRAQPADLDRASTTWTRVGSAADNVAVAALSYAREEGTAAPLRVLASVVNFGSQPAQRRLTLRQGNATALVEPVSIPPGERVTIVHSLPDRSGPLTATIESADALAADDTRSIDVVPTAARRVQMIDVEPALARAVRALPAVSIVDDNPTVVVCGRCEERPATGPLLMTRPAAGTTPVEALTLTSATHPVAAALSFDGVRAAPAAAALAEGDTVIAMAGDVPAIVANETGGRRVVELRMDPARGGLALDPAFPMLVANALEWLSPAGLERQAVGMPLDESDLRSDAAASVSGGSSAVVDGPVADATAPMLLLALLAVAGEWLIAHRQGRARGRRSVAVAPRVAALALLVLAVGGVRVPGGTAPVTAVVALDRSASMGRAAGALARLASLGGGQLADDRLGVVVFGATAGVERRPAPGAATPEVTSDVERGGTNIEAGLRAARAALPSEGARRIVLVSDGRETAGDARREAARARQQGIRIDVLAPDWLANDLRPLSVTRLDAPPAVRIGEPVQVTALIAGSAGAAGELVLRRNGAVVGTVDVTVPAAGQTSIAFIDRPVTTGPLEYHATTSLAADDFAESAADDDGAGAVVIVSGTARLLHVRSTPPDPGRPLAPAGFLVDTAVPTQVPRSATALSAYDAVILDDVAGDELEAAQGVALAEYVEQRAGGLLILGTARSLEPDFGGQPGLAAIAPLDFRPRGGQRAPAAALVVVFDKSGSMADLVDGAPKIEYARQAVEGVLQAVSPADQLGVIAFDASAVPVVPLDAGHTAEFVKARLRGTTPGGSTAIGPALELARRWLTQPPAAASARRHILLVSDGRTSEADAGLAMMVAAEPGIEISTVALDAASDRNLLRALAARSGGRAFVPADARALPRLLAREASRVAGGRVVEEPTQVRIEAHPVTAGLEDGGVPTIGGYVVGAARAQTDAALVSTLGDPVLATSRAGLGRVGVYTADLRSSWSEQIRSWDRFPTLLAQTVRWVARRTASGGLYAAIRGTDAGMHVVVETEDRALVDARAEVRRPDGTVDAIALAPTVPGRFEGSVAAAESGAYLFSISARGDGAEARVIRGHSWMARRELSAAGVDLPLLTEVARLTGGRVMAANESVFAGPRDRPWRPGAPWLAAAALVVLLALWLSATVADLVRRIRSRRGASLSPSPGTA